MLTITENARDLVRRIPNQPRFLPTAGLRIFRLSSGDGALNVRVENEPLEGDQVVDHGGARVFLGQRAVAALANKTLDARLAPDGRIEFTLRPCVSPA